MRLDSTTTQTSLYANSINTMTSADRAIANYSYNELSQVRLVIYMGCSAGTTDSIKGNIVDKTLTKGASVCIGWKQTIKTWDACLWLKEFFYQCSLGYSVEIALIETSDALRSKGVIDHNTITDIYYGSSNIGGLAI